MKLEHSRQDRGKRCGGLRSTSTLTNEAITTVDEASLSLGARQRRG